MNWENSIESYKTYLILEKALSEKSVEAYLNDIR
jgi:integrase/recombinase XerD